jgi:hypothetical protein
MKRLLARDRVALGLIIGIYLALALTLSLAVPLGEAPDEVSHWAFVQYLSEFQRLPEPKGAVLGESHQPPLYYLLGAWVTSSIDTRGFQAIANPDFRLDSSQTPNVLLHTRREAFPYEGAPLAWHLVRLLSLAMGAVTIWATWRIARESLPGRPWIAFGAAAFVALLPEFLFISAVVNNDNLVVMLSALAVLVVLRARRQMFHWRDVVVLGLLLGLAPFTKMSGFVLWPFSAGVILFGRHARGEGKAAVLRLAVCFAIAAGLIAPWLINNLVRYGDALGWSLVLMAVPTRQAPMGMADWVSLLRGLFLSFWGRFGGAAHLGMADAVYASLGGFGLVALLGWFRHAHDARQGQTEEGVLGLAGTFALFWLIMLGAHLRWTLAVLGTDQARQLFPGLPLLAVILVAGLARLFGSRAHMAIAVWSAAACLLAVGFVVNVQSVYAAPVANQAESVRPGPGMPPADFGQVIRVASYQIENVAVRPGGAVIAHVEWQALSSPSENYWLLLQLVGNQGVVVNKEGVPAAGRVTTDWWRPGEVYRSSHVIEIPEDLSPGTYTLRLGLHPFGRWEWLGVRGQETLELEKVNVIP